LIRLKNPVYHDSIFRHSLLYVHYYIIPCMLHVYLLHYLYMNHEALAQQGLNTHKAQELLKKYGFNEITEKKKKSIFITFISQFNNFLILLLIGAGTLSLFLHEIIDSLFIFFIILLNAFFGIYQEFKAEKSLEALKDITITTTRVIRNGSEQTINSAFLVPGDIVYIEEGTKIPADARLIQSRYLEVNESSLTGESLPVLKNEIDEENKMIFMGTVVAKGRGYARVEKTGNATQFGKIARTLTSIKDQKTPLQHKLEIFSKQIGIIGIIASILVFLLSYGQNGNIFTSFLFAVSLAVAAVPEGLPAVMTITLAIGVERMSKKKAIVRKLNAIETLGSITLVATDKTGTLTTNQMRVKNIWFDNYSYTIENIPSSSHQTFSQLLLNSILCSTTSLIVREGKEYEVVGDQTEGALLILAKQARKSIHTIRNEWNIRDEVSFDPIKKRMSVVASSLPGNKNTYIFSKGAPESILSICTHILSEGKEVLFTVVQKKAVNESLNSYTKKGLRVIAFSHKRISSEKEKKPILLTQQDWMPDTKSDHTFIGFVGIADPVRKEAREAVIKAHKAGIKVVMITGDNPLTANTIGIETGIVREGEPILTGKQMDTYSDSALIPLIKHIKIFARTSPDHKHRLVSLFQKMGEVVAVTGDGVNDALALKQANVGVAMGMTGTDVAKEASDMIITDDNFATLINAIEEGRNIFNHLKNVIKYLITSNTAEVLTIVLGLIFRFPLVLTALQILYINLVTDGLPALSLAFSPKDSHVMSQKPRTSLTILHRHDLIYILSIGFLGGVLTVISFSTGFALSGIDTARTMAFTTLVFVQPLILVDLWLSHRIIIRNMNLLKKPIFLISFASAFLIQPFLIYHPFFQQIFKTVSVATTPVTIAFLLSLVILLPIEIKKIKK